MNKLLIFSFVLTILFISCDGRHRTYQSNQENLKEHNLYESFSESVTYIPESYSEVMSDTLMNNGYHVKFKTYTDMDNSFLNVLKKDMITHKNYYRNLKTAVNISKDNQNIATTLITKDFVMNYDASYKAVLKNKIMQGVWLNQYASINTNSVVMDILFIDPKENATVCYRLTVNDNGDYSIESKPQSKAV
jgi:hypothetical protein